MPPDHSIPPGTAESTALQKRRISVNIDAWKDGQWAWAEQQLKDVFSRSQIREISQVPDPHTLVVNREKNLSVVHSILRRRVESQLLWPGDVGTARKLERVEFVLQALQIPFTQDDESQTLFSWVERALLEVQTPVEKQWRFSELCNALVAMFALKRRERQAYDGQRQKAIKCGGHSS